ncbi:MAG: hypothetical protein R8K46_06290 [Mariprofundaceae bacterium]
MRILISLIALLCLAPISAVAEDAIDTTIDQILEAYGGRDRLLAVKAYRLEATMQAVRRDEQADVFRIVEGIDRFTLMLRYPSQTEVRVFSQGRVWQGNDPEQLDPAQGPPADAIALQAARINIVRLLDVMRIRVRQGEASETNSVLELRLAANLWVRALIDKATHHVIGTQSMMRVGEQSMVFETLYSDFRQVDGVLFAFREEKYASGAHMGSIDVHLIEINPKPERLKLPSGKELPS